MRSDLGIDEKLEFLVTASLPKDKLLDCPPIVLEERMDNIEIDKPIIAKSLLKTISAIWQAMQSEKHPIEYSTEVLIDRSFCFLNILYINEEPSELARCLCELL